MNSKLKLHILSRSTEQGFAMFAALGIGLVMFLVGITMVVRSQGDQLTANTQKSTTKSLSATEVGLTRIQALLKLIPKLSQKNFSDWPATYTAYITGKTCLSGLASTNLLAGNWVNVDDNDLTKGKFKIVSYVTDGSTSGTLTLAGQDGASNSFNSTSSVQVKIPLVTLIGIPVPALWAQNFTMGNNAVQGNVLVHGCTIPNGVSSGNVQPLPDGTQSAVIPNVSVAYPDLPALPQVCPTSGQMPQSCYQLFKNSQTTTLANIPEFIDANTTLPRSWDKAGADGVYRYLIGKDTSNQPKSIDLQQNGETLTIVTDDSTNTKTKVVLYLQGNIEMGGQTKINHISSKNNVPVKAANFVIYGSDGLGNYKHALDSTQVSNYKTTSILIGGNSSAAMVIYAPEATAGVNGGGNQQSTITGTVWTKSWNGSNANQVVVTQNLQWSELTDFTPPKTIAAIQSWQRQEAP